MEAREKVGEKSLSVSELTAIIRTLIEDEPLLKDVWVRGEISNLRQPASGHLYFTLKDEFCAVECVFFNFARQRKSKPLDGSLVMVLGDVSVYEKKSQYQLVVRDIVAKGEGILAQRFEELKRKLFAEGLFAEEHKLPLPKMPKVIGVVTSGDSAAFTDVLKVLSRRAPYLRVVLFECQVQGDMAPPTIIHALHLAEKFKGIDVILLVRGGGSLEDLFCFNDEKLARTIYHLKVPVITGIGHEIDYTIADFVADKRAPTPSASAEIVAPSVEELIDSVVILGDKLISILSGRVKEAQIRLVSLGFERFVRQILRKLRFLSDATSSLMERLAKTAFTKLVACEGKMRSFVSLFSARRILVRIDNNFKLLDDFSEELILKTFSNLSARLSALKALEDRLVLLDPRGVLKRGYALLWKKGMRKVVKRAEEVEAGEAVTAELHDGYVEAKAKRVRLKENS